jgi:hypothetical protein
MTTYVPRLWGKKTYTLKGKIKFILLYPAIQLVLWYMTSYLLLQKIVSLCFPYFRKITSRNFRDYFVIFYLEVQPGQLLPTYEVITKIIIYTFNIGFDGNNERQVCTNSSLLSLCSAQLYMCSFYLHKIMSFT